MQMIKPPLNCPKLRELNQIVNKVEVTQVDHDGFFVHRRLHISPLALKSVIANE